MPFISTLHTRELGRRFAWIVAAALIGACGRAARAEPEKTKGADAAARALFYEARRLMQDGRYDVACPKLDESLKLVYGIGTEFNLAECNERLGKVSSAWSGFLHVATAAKAQNQVDREQLARERAGAIEPRVPKLVIDVPNPAPDLEVIQDGVTIDASSWGRPEPIDPGLHRVTASVARKTLWDESVSVPEGAVVHIAIPRDLADPVISQVFLDVSTPASRAVQAPEAGHDNVMEERGRVQRTAGWVMGGLGLAGIGVGAWFGIDSMRQRGRSESHCIADRCDAAGVALRDRALQSGDISTVLAATSAAALIGGAVLFFTAPRGSSSTVASIALRAVPHMTADGGDLYLQGALP